MTQHSLDHGTNIQVACPGCQTTIEAEGPPGLNNFNCPQCGVLFSVEIPGTPAAAHPLPASPPAPLSVAPVPTRSWGLWAVCGGLLLAIAVLAIGLVLRGQGDHSVAMAAQPSSPGMSPSASVPADPTEETEGDWLTFADESRRAVANLVGIYDKEEGDALAELLPLLKSGDLGEAREILNEMERNFYAARKQTRSEFEIFSTRYRSLLEEAEVDVENTEDMIEATMANELKFIEGLKTLLAFLENPDVHEAPDRDPNPKTEFDRLLEAALLPYRKNAEQSQHLLDIWNKLIAFAEEKAASQQRKLGGSTSHQ